MSLALDQRRNVRRQGRLWLLASSMAALVAGFGATAAQAAEAATAAAAEEPAGDTIIVTGTRRTDRTVTESAVPVDVFSSEIKTQASPSLQTILKNLVPSFNQQRNAGADGSAFVRPPTLRGLPPDEILVLVNGKRMHRSALVQVAGDSLTAGSQGPDLSQLPSVALARIEVLRDGAAAQYGSDAIAGVINLGLRTNDSGYEINGRYGQTYKGDGQDYQISGNAGFKLGEGYINISAEYIDQGPFNRAAQRPDAAPLTALGYTLPNPVTRYGQPKNQAYRFVVNSAIPVGDNEIYFFGNYGRAKAEVDFNYRRPVTVTVSPGAVPAPGGTAAPSQTFGKSIPTVYLDTIAGQFDSSGRPVYSATGRTFEASEFFPNGFTPIFLSSNEDYSGVIGYRGETGFGMKFDFSAAAGTNKIRYTMTDTLNPSLGPQSPTDFYLGSLQQNETNINLDLSYPLAIGLASPLNIAAGLEFRRESYIVGLGQLESYQLGPYASQTVQNADGTRFVSNKPIGANGFPGYGPDAAADGSRTSYSAYLDLEADLVEGVTLGLAGRYDHFSDFGDTVNGKASGRWAITSAIAIRGAVSTGFRAPTPGQNFTANVQTAFPGGSVVPVAVATVTPVSVTGRYFGSIPLKPEKSFSLSGGLVLTPGGGFTATLDFYQIEVRDRIGLSSNFTVTAADRTALAALGVANASDLGVVTYFTNAFRTRTQGVDLVVSHRADTGSLGTFNTSLAVNYNKTKVTDRTLRANGTPLAIDDQRRNNIEGLNPRWRFVLAESWKLGMFDATGRLNFYGGITSYNSGATTGATVQNFRPDISFDLEVGVTIKENYRFAIGGENLFNRYPEREQRNLFAQTGAPANGRLYNDASPLSYAGGFWYIRGQAKF
ncbi:TonB-dependent receptor [alpha proteobacterium AAP81b]|nr:TonB-dependent receptor [alpha proteobacterium AAP81b]